MRHLANRMHHSRSQNGFTLLEVMVALTITGLALGSLFGIIVGSKQLAWRSEQVLIDVSQTRTLINLSQLNDERGEVQIELENNDLVLETGEAFDSPERKTQASQFALRKYDVADDNGEVIVSGSYWIELDFPEL